MRGILSVLAALCFGGAAVRASELQVVLSGKYAGTLESYRAGSTYYLNAKQAGSLYGGQVYWYPVTGRVQLSVRGRQMRFLVNSDEARVGDKTVKLGAPVLARASNAYVPMGFFLSAEFADLLGMDTQFDARTGLLTVDKRTSVGPLRWFSYRDRTRIVLELEKRLSWSLSKRRGGFDVSFPMGKIDWSEHQNVDDGIVGLLQLSQEPRAARLSVRLDAAGAQWRTRELSDPRRVVIDVYRGALPPASARTEGSTDESEGSAAAPGAPARPPASSAAREAPAAAAQKNALPRIVIDAGHGGKDSGALGRHGAREKDLNLLAARELASRLREDGAFEVMLIRADDTFVPLDERSRRANEFNADLFISLHCNASPHRSENGFEMYFLSETASDPESQRVADAENASLELEGKSMEEQEAAGLLHAMAKTEFINDASELAGLMANDLARRVDLADRGVKQAAFYVLRGTNAPAVLVEMGFVSNAKDEARLSSKRFRRRLMEGLYSGLLDFAQRRHWPSGEPR